MRWITSCMLACALAPAFGAEWKFDMGTDKSPVWPGFEKVTKATAYSTERGFGWVGKVFGEGQRDVPDALGCDFVLGRATFQLDVPAGEYVVWALLGDSGCGINHPRFWAMPYQIKANREVAVSVEQSVESYYRDYYFSNLYADYEPGQSLWEKYFAKYDRPHWFKVSAPQGQIQLEFPYHVPVDAVAVFPADAEEQAKASVAELRDARKQAFDDAFKLAPVRDESPAREATAEEAERGYVLFHRSSGESIYPHTRPAPEDGSVDLAVFATPGEYEPITFSVWPLADLSDVGVRVGPLRTERGDVLPADAMSLARVKYVEQRRAGSGDYVLKPRTLLPYELGNLHRDVTKRFWFTVHVPAGQAAGEYRGEITFEPKGRPAATIPVSVKVLPFELVEDAGIAYGTYYYSADSTTYRGHGACGKPPARSAWAQEQALKLTEADMRDMRAHGMTCAAMSPTWGLFRVKDDQVVADEEKWQWYGHFMNLYVKAGFRRPLAAYGIGFSLPLYVPERVDVKNWQIGGQFSERYVKHYTEMVRRYYERAHAEKAKGRWPEVVFYASDELSNLAANGADWGCANLRLLREARKQVPGGFRICSSMNGPPEWRMLPLLDIGITNNGFPINEETIAKVRAAGAEWWAYNIGWSRFSWGFYLLKTGAKGRLQWHYRCNPRGTCDPCNWLTSMVWAVVDTAPDGPLPTREWENVREGVDDARYVRTLEQWIARAKHNGKPKAVQAAARAQETIDWILDRTDANLSYYIADVGYWDPPVFDQLRWRIAQAILNVREALQ